MNAQRKDLIEQPNQNHTPRVFSKAVYSLEETEYLAKRFSESSLCPSSLKGRPNDVFAIMCFGRDMNLTPMQSVQFLGSINGLPFAYGDGLTALCQRHPEYIGLVEVFEGSFEDGTAKYTCTMKRKNKPDVTNSYSWAEAVKAGLTGKDNWRKHPRRMLQRRARSYTAKDQFADALMGLISEDEAEDIIKVEEVKTSTNRGMGGFHEILGVKEEKVIEAEIIEPQKPLLQQLMDLIIEKGVADKTIESWTKKANVQSIDEMDEVTLEKCINHLRKKENGIQTSDGSGDKAA